MTRLSSLDRLLLTVIALLLAVIAAQGAGVRLAAPAAAQGEAAPAASAATAPAPAPPPGGPVAAFPIDNLGRFVVVDGAGRRMMFCEVVWTGPDASLVVRKITDY